MAGLTDNQNLLSAANQLIKAVNDLADKVGVTDISSIADAIEAQTTMLETRSVAETEAQNTNFADLVESVGSVSVTVDTSGLVNAISTCCSNINSKLGLMIAAIKSIRLVTSGGGGGGTSGVSGVPILDPPPIIPEDPGQPPTGEVDLEKCKAANYVYWTIIYYLRFISTYQNFVYSLINESNVEAIIVGALVATLIAPPVALLEGIAVGLVSLLMLSGNWAITAYFGYLADSLEEVKEDIICNLYTAQDADEARNYIHSLIDDRIDAVAAIPVEAVWGPMGFPLTLLKLTLAQVAKYIAGNYLVNVLFDPSPDVEAAEIPDAIECDVCGCTIRFEFTESVEGWVERADTNDNVVTNSWSTNEALRTEIAINYNGTGAVGYWEYFPGEHGKTWVVSEGDTFEARVNCTDHPNNGGNMWVVFTDEDIINIFLNVTAGATTFTATIDAGRSGKTVEKLLLAYTLGSASGAGSSSIAEWDYMQVSLSGGGC